MLVSQVMTRDVETCSPHDSLDAVGRICWDHDVGVVPVVEAGRVVGVVTDRDACMAVYTRGCALRDALVASAMTTTPLTCRPEVSVAEALRIMSDAQVRRLLVTDDGGRLVGVLSMNDIVREAAQGSARLALEVVKALAAVGAPRVAAADMLPAATDLVSSGDGRMSRR